MSGPDGMLKGCVSTPLAAMFSASLRVAVGKIPWIESC